MFHYGAVRSRHTFHHPSQGTQPHVGAWTAEYCRPPSAPAAWSEPADWVSLEPGLSSKPLRSVAWVCVVLPQSRCSFIRVQRVMWCWYRGGTCRRAPTQRTQLREIQVFVFLQMLFLCVFTFVWTLWAVMFVAKCQQLAGHGHEWMAASTSCLPNHLVGKDTVGHWFAKLTSGMFR